MDFTSIVFVSSIILGLFAIFFVILVVLYNNRQRFFKQEKELLQQSYENRIMQTKLEIAEDTAQKISRALHDNIGQKLSAAKLLSGNPGTSSEDIKEILGEVINDVRDLSRTLKTEPKINKGLIPGLYYLADLLKQQGINVDESLGDEPQLDVVEKLTMYRVCQEAVQNILKHANAKQVSITSKATTNTFKLIIIDDGKGFNKTTVTLGSGLENMQNRCESIGVEFKIDSTPNNGCTIIITKKIAKDE